MYAVKLVYLPQWDLEFFKILACQEFPICMTYAAFSYHYYHPKVRKVRLNPHPFRKYLLATPTTTLSPARRRRWLQHHVRGAAKWH